MSHIFYNNNYNSPEKLIILPSKYNLTDNNKKDVENLL